MGWARAFTYWAHRVNRLPGSTYSLSAGIAFGAAISFTPFVGLHLVLALAAWVFAPILLHRPLALCWGSMDISLYGVWIYQLGIWMGVGSLPENMGLEFTAPSVTYSPPP